MDAYYEDDHCTIYHGDCRELIDAMPTPDLVLADPPYGVNERTDRATAKRGAGEGRLAWGKSQDFPPVYDDDKPFDPSHLIHLPCILWGANHYADRLPSSPSWIVWDKLNGLTSEKRAIGLNDNADCELAWTNLGGPARLVPHRWMGLMRESEQMEPRVHPTQKPVALMAALIDWRTAPGQLILDPYMGSGPTMRAAKDLGRKAIGIEIEERYCEIAANRLGQEVMNFDA